MPPECPERHSQCYLARASRCVVRSACSHSLAFWVGSPKPCAHVDVHMGSCLLSHPNRCRILSW
eukprot:6740033-Alexandrium_andersonii.AAC.1